MSTMTRDRKTVKSARKSELLVTLAMGIDHTGLLDASAPAPCCDPEAAPCKPCAPAVEVLAVEATDGAIPTVNALATVLDVPAAAAVELPMADTFPPDRGLDPWDAESPAELWPDETDNWFWTANDDIELEPSTPAEPAPATLDLAELVDAQAAAYRAWPLDAGEMIARALDELALKIRMTGSTTPAELEARVEVLDREIRDQWEARGFDAGKAACCSCHHDIGSAFGHSA